MTGRGNKLIGKMELNHYAPAEADLGRTANCSRTRVPLSQGGREETPGISPQTRMWISENGRTGQSVQRERTVCDTNTPPPKKTKPKTLPLFPEACLNPL